MPEENLNEDLPLEQEQNEEQDWRRKLNKDKIASRRVPQTKGAAGSKAGAVVGALEGEGIGGVAETLVSQRLLWVAFVALFTLVGSIPALLYLDFHYIMSKGGSKWFSEMFIWQKIVLALANFLFLFVLIIALALISVIYCLNPLNINNCGWQTFTLGATTIGNALWSYLIK